MRIAVLATCLLTAACVSNRHGRSESADGETSLSAESHFESSPRDAKDSLTVEIIGLHFASANELSQQLTTLFHHAIPVTVVPDQRTNSLLVRGTHADIDLIRALVARLDQQVKP